MLVVRSLVLIVMILSPRIIIALLPVLGIAKIPEMNQNEEAVLIMSPDVTETIPDGVETIPGVVTTPVLTVVANVTVLKNQMILKSTLMMDTRLRDPVQKLTALTLLH
jgi:hypothetical protein